MIAHLSGQVHSVEHNTIVLLTPGGVGYRIFATPAALELAKPGHELALTTHLVVKEDALDLYGFASLVEKQLFELLITVSGVGPKTALNILALGSAASTMQAIAQGNVAYLTRVSGIGKKTAERLVLELQGKFSAAAAGPALAAPSSAAQDVIDGLEALGYPAATIRAVFEELDIEGKTSEELLREALRMLSK